MTKIIQLSDLHLAASRQEGAATLQRLVAAINEDHADAALCVVTGDLADDGRSESYALLLDGLAALRVPCLLGLGNHDRRAPFAQVFPDRVGTADGFVQQARVAGDITAIVLDTLEEGKDHGRLCRRRLDWYAATLEAVTTPYALVFLHHPPIALGLEALDAIALHNPAAFWRLTRAAPQVRGALCGHVHRDSATLVEGVLVTTCRGGGPEFPLAHGGDPGRARPSRPSLTCAVVATDRLTIHTERIGHDPGAE